MQVIRRVAALAHAFVSLNYEQAAAIKYVLRPADDPGVSRQVGGLAGGSRLPRGGSAAKLAALSATVVGALTLAGTPVSEAGSAAVAGLVRGAVATVHASRATLSAGALGGEPVSLLLLATGFFGAAVIVRRRIR